MLFGKILFDMQTLQYIGKLSWCAMNFLLNFSLFSNVATVNLHIGILP